MIWIGIMKHQDSFATYHLFVQKTKKTLLLSIWTKRNHCVYGLFSQKTTTPHCSLTQISFQRPAILTEVLMFLLSPSKQMPQ
jgi:hypothetical protein